MGILQKLNITVFPTAKCKKFFDERMTPRMMCAGFEEGGKDSCKVSDINTYIIVVIHSMI